ncbi:MAG: hypothetical protein IPM82_21770 [Saprospiraceae bacterium]|nr:hypothetical protein [Saprospiraceae bacterium]
MSRILSRFLNIVRAGRVSSLPNASSVSAIISLAMAYISRILVCSRMDLLKSRVGIQHKIRNAGSDVADAPKLLRIFMVASTQPQVRGHWLEPVRKYSHSRSIFDPKN